MKKATVHLSNLKIYYILPLSMLSLFILYYLVFGLKTNVGNDDAVQAPQESRFASTTNSSDSLPSVLANNRPDLVKARLKHEAARKFGMHRLPNNLEEWEKQRTEIRNLIIQKTGMTVDHNLPLNIRETGAVQMKGYAIRNISFQTKKDVYATANLYVPEGNGPFPGVIHMIGHWNEGKIGSVPQGVGHSLAQYGYVALVIDPWGAGERAPIHGEYEYHGGNLGASMFNIGESLMGIHISENMRGVDLLCALPYVNPDQVGATGASGGGNQTMWLAAIDERVKAAVTVVSVGTFESYIMGNNCICETLVDGLTFTEEAGVLGLVAPRALSIYNGSQDQNPAFSPSEMLRSYNNAKPVFELLGAGNKLNNRIFDLPHGYHPEMREAMVGWFDLHLKGIGTGDPIEEKPFDLVPEEKLMVFPKGERDTDVLTTEAYCRLKGEELRNGFLENTAYDVEKKKNELGAILRMNEMSGLKGAKSTSTGKGWNLITLETSDNKLIPLLLHLPVNRNHKFTVISHPGGKDSITPDLINELMASGSGIAIVDLSGTGELTSTSSRSYDSVRKLHTLSRAELWLGKTVLGEWAKELGVVVDFLNAHYQPSEISLDGTKESGLAGLSLATFDGKNIGQVILREAPVSYLFDTQEGIDFFSMAIHLPGILKWGDVSLMAALSGKNITFIKPVTMSGKKLMGGGLQEFQIEFDNVRQLTRLPGKTGFVE